ncbi:LysR family transcriptional regulator [Gluconacetobacter tumulicola]|uniref:LysR family transcriptional regulator n=1 Tax=Gluconacetobacter tumulicola TaxID=1017177 RepID=A0A7W4P6H8_9PROT|nr:LysR family transcriptional regulator [Gluconacetobacter tumulicola]MBB2179127.1 LysR family transcriptional regulator [Gluconacetobacter tumulicola]
MTLEQLRIFIAVAEREHMTAGAKALNVTQSAASAAIAALEERHDVRLFHRVGRGIALTEAGRLFLTEARAVLARTAAAENVLDDLGALRRGTLRVVASQTIAAYWLPPLLADFRRHYPALSIALAIRNTEQAAAQVHTGEAEIGIIEGQVDDPTLTHWPIGEDRLLLVQADPFDDTPVDATWLQRARWIMREDGSGTRSTLDRHLRRLGIASDSLDVALVLPSNESVRTAVEAGAGIAALSSLVVAPCIRAGTLHAAPLSFGPRAFFGLRHKERYRSMAAQALLAFITASTRQ